jgi:hypothetical protein
MPLTSEQLKLLQTAFRPHAAIEDPDSFFGRDREMEKLREALTEAGLQVIVYGEPGCGKTSIANVATKDFPRLKVFCEADADFAGILRDTALGLSALDPQRYVYDGLKGTMSVAGTILPLGKMTGNGLLSLLPKADPFCVIFDEIDRVKDKRVVAAIAELAKNAATTCPDVTFVLVGVAETAGGLLHGHSSNFRNILELPLDRMREPGMRDILSHGEKVLSITFSDEVSTEIIQLCDGMPYFLHLLAKHAAKAAMEVRAPTVEMDDLLRGSVEAAGAADQQLRTNYDLAIMADGEIGILRRLFRTVSDLVINREHIADTSTSVYQRIIWAMASLPKKGNNVAEITSQTNKIKIEALDGDLTENIVRSALKRLTTKEKGQLLSQPFPGIYSFSSPLMKGFVRLVRYGL